MTTQEKTNLLNEFVHLMAKRSAMDGDRARLEARIMELAELLQIDAKPKGDPDPDEEEEDDEELEPDTDDEGALAPMPPRR